LEVPYWTSS